MCTHEQHCIICIRDNESDTYWNRNDSLYLMKNQWKCHDCWISDVSEQKGIPDFWLNLLESQTFLPEQIQVLFIVEPTFLHHSVCVNEIYTSHMWTRIFLRHAISSTSFTQAQYQDSCICPNRHNSPHWLSPYKDNSQIGDVAFDCSTFYA